MTKFVSQNPPNLAQLKAYCRAKDLNVNCEKFLEFFTRTNWVDANNKRVKNWKLKILTWATFNPATGKSAKVHLCCVCKTTEVQLEYLSKGYCWPCLEKERGY